MGSLIKEYLDLSEKYKKLTNSYVELKKEKDALLGKVKLLELELDEFKEKQSTINEQQKNKCVEEKCEYISQESIGVDQLEDDVELTEFDTIDENLQPVEDETIEIKPKRKRKNKKD